MELKTIQLTLTGDEETLKKIQSLLAMMHYNAGHSATFGMDFDGDGHSRLTVSPAPDESLRRPAQKIGDVGAAVEMAGPGFFFTRKPAFVSDAKGLRKRE